MRLLDYATVVVGNGHWMKGWEAEDRMSGLEVEVFDPCGTLDVPIVTSTGVNRYDVVPFGIKAGFARSLLCGQDDDKETLGKALKAAAEPGVGYATSIEHADGTDTWIGDGRVLQAADIPAGRQLWLDHNVGTPALHLADDTVIQAQTDKVIRSIGEGDGLVTAWGDPVVNSPGYKPGEVFWSGPITVYLSDIDTDLLYNVHNNESRVIANLIAALDMPPTQVVRIGAVPA